MRNLSAKDHIMTRDEEIPKNDIDWENRELCSDGNCIGVIGTDGRCRVCGLKSAKKMPSAHMVQNPEAGFCDDDEEPIPSSESHNEEDVMDDDWKNRVLCSDESCIGTIGPEGTCNECGKPLSQ